MKRQEGQIFSLDLLISLVAVTLAVGLLLQAIEVNTYYQKAERPAKELKTMAETAASIIMAGNETNCEDDYGETIMNCIDEDAGDAEFSQMFPPGYGYEVKVGGETKSSSGSLAQKDFYEITRLAQNGIVAVKVWKE